MAGPPRRQQRSSALRRHKQMSWSRTIPGTLFLLLLTAGPFLLTPAARASSALVVSVEPSAASFVPGTDAVLFIRARGESPALANLSFAVEGGTLSGAVALNEVSPGVAEGAAFVRRDTPGDVTLTVLMGGYAVSRGVAHFAAVGRIEVRVTLAADAHAAARTWRFEVVDPTGAIVESLSAGTSGDAPTGVAQTAPLPYGRYTVRQLLGNDTRLACSAGIFYEVSAPAGGAATVDLASGAAVASFAIRPCADAPRDLGVSMPVDPVATSTPIDEVKGARSSGTPLPPDAGTGLAAEGGGLSPWLPLLAGSALVAGSLGAALCVVKRPARPPD